MNSQEPTYFASPAELQVWFTQHASERSELWVGFHKKDSGLASITWPESVDEALCVGWIDGVRKRVDDKSYKIRFTPRKPGSTWSSVNIKRVAELEAEGRLMPAGRAAFERRQEKRSSIYAYEQDKAAQLSSGQEALFRARPAAWEYFQGQAPSYRRACIWHVVTAKRPETQAKRLEALIAASARGERL